MESKRQLKLIKKTYNSKHSPSAVNEFGLLVSLQILRDLAQSKWVEPKVTATHQPNKPISKKCSQNNTYCVALLNNNNNKPKL
jgi:hypothetical protein